MQRTVAGRCLFMIGRSVAPLRALTHVPTLPLWNVTSTVCTKGNFMGSGRICCSTEYDVLVANRAVIRAGFGPDGMNLVEK